MNEQVISNIHAVRAEAHEALDNMIAVKGKRHTALVKSFLLSSNMSEIFGLVVNTSDIGVEGKEILTDSFMRCVHGLIVGMAMAGDISDDDMTAAIHDAEAMDKSFTGLMRQAVSSGAQGKAFGDPQ